MTTTNTAAALAEIGGAYLIWIGIKEHRGVAFVALGAMALTAYGVVPAFQPSHPFGRVLAAYGGVFIVGSLLWGVAFDGFHPDRADLIGVAIAWWASRSSCTPADRPPQQRPPLSTRRAAHGLELATLLHPGRKQ
jgi:small multidrug resistance family-3 protein